MVWHIFKKDCRVLWPWVVLVTAMHVAAAAPLALNLSDRNVGNVIVLSFIALVSMLLLTANVVHQDALPSIQQDWHVRPIRRGPLLLSKLVFVLLMVHGPLLLTDCGVGLAAGFPVLDSIRAALVRGAWIGCCLTLPALALATLTRNPMEALAAGLVTLLAFFILSPGTANLITPIDQRWELGAGALNAQTGLVWMQRGAIAATLLVSGAAIVSFRYFRRSTARAWGLFAAAVGLVAMVVAIPWKTAFAIQERLASRPDLASTVSLTFEPSPQSAYAGWRVQTSEQYQHTNLPLRISGLPPHSFLVRDKVTLRLSALDGTRLYNSTTAHSMHFPLDRPRLYATASTRFMPESRFEAGEGLIPETINIPADLYGRVREEPVRIEIDYSLTLMTLERTYTLPLTDIPRYLEKLGWCTTRDRFQPSAVSLRCFNLNRPQLCIQAGRDIGQEEPGQMSFFTDCRPNYAPVGVSLLPGGLHRLGGAMMSSAWNPNGISMDVAGPITLRTFAPQAHFTRKVVVPSVRLMDLESGAQSRPRQQGAG